MLFYLRIDAKYLKVFLFFIFSLSFASGIIAQRKMHSFNVIAFYTGKLDEAHISFATEANNWFPKMAIKNNFSYDTTTDWTNLNETFLKKYQVIIFLDTRPDEPSQRAAFEKYINNGGAWMGFHFAAFALTPSDYPQNWDWYHNNFLGSGSYVSNTWKPTSAILKVEDLYHPATKNLPVKFKSAPNEWYRWTNNLKDNPDIKILASIDSSSFPLGTGPKLHEIWHSGYYPVVWTNIKYKMIYFNMGHNDIDYSDHSPKTLSFTFRNKQQNKLILNALLWLGNNESR